MTKRLVEQFQVDDAVEICLADDRWFRGRVLRHDPPGIWVQTANGQTWFVTNTRHIRKVKEERTDD